MKKLALLVSILLFSVNSFAEKKLEHLFEEWHVITDTQNDEKICYIASLAAEQEGNVTRTTDPYLLVAKFIDRDPEVSVSSGFSYKAGSEVKFSIKDNLYTLDKIQNNIAWAKNNTLDQDLIRAMKAGMVLEVKSTSQDGKYAIESYSLKGFTNAYNKMVDLCKNIDANAVISPSVSKAIPANVTESAAAIEGEIDNIEQNDEESEDNYVEDEENEDEEILYGDED
jgi:invasion protein IalB